MKQPRVSRQQAECIERLNGTDHIADLGKYTYELTLDEAARWLREVKGWHVEVEWVRADVWCCDISHIGAFINVGMFPTHDLALSAGIDLILKKLDEQ